MWVFVLMNILFIDQSLRNTGVCILEDGGKYHLMSIKPPKALRDEPRLLYIHGKIQEILRTYKIQRVVIEGYSFGSRGRAIFQLGELGGMLKMLFYQLQIPFEVIPPTSHKKSTTGRGNAKKEDVVKAVIAFGYDVADDNQADAVSLKIHYEKSLGKSPKTETSPEQLSMDLKEVA